MQMFFFSFWKCGKWIPIVIDDRLPVHSGKLLFMKAPHWEFWPALLEKAYAKFYGSYGAIEGGHASEAMTDFTGGVIERYVLRRAPANLFTIILKGHERGSLVSVAVNRTEHLTEFKRSKGIVEGHAYSLTKARVINAGSKKEVKIVRIKNPWSNETEWNGPFGDESLEWNFVPEHEKREMKVQFCDDGEFYMTMKDFLKHFDSIEFCHISPDSLETNDEKKKWNLTTYEGKWISAITYSPQIIVKLVDPDEYDDDDYCTMVVSLHQKNRRNMRSDMNQIRFEIYKLTADDAMKTLLPSEFFLSQKPVGDHKMQRYREICARFRFLPGYYAIVPQTLCHETGEFMLRIFTESMRHGPTEEVIVKVNEKSKKTHETNIEIFAIDDVVPAAATLQVHSQLEGETLTCECSFLIIFCLVFIMFFGGFFVILYLDNIYMKQH